MYFFVNTLQIQLSQIFDFVITLRVLQRDNVNFTNNELEIQ